VTGERGGNKLSISLTSSNNIRLNVQEYKSMKERQEIREIAIKFYNDMLGYEQAKNLIDNISRNTQDVSVVKLAITTKLELERYA